MYPPESLTRGGDRAHDDAPLHECDPPPQQPCARRLGQGLKEPIEKFVDAPHALTRVAAPMSLPRSPQSLAQAFLEHCDHDQPLASVPKDEPSVGTSLLNNRPQIVLLMPCPDCDIQVL
jgi:hypothetical protein